MVCLKQLIEDPIFYRGVGGELEPHGFERGLAKARHEAGSIRNVFNENGACHCKPIRIKPNIGLVN